MRVESAPHHGSIFHFTASLGVAPASENNAPSELPDLRGLPVLIVDDNATNRRILHDNLARWGMMPECVDGAARAIETLSAAREAGKNYALLVIDSQMPEMDGFQLAEWIHANSRWIRSTVMMLTSAGSHGDRERSRQLGIASYMMKPVTQADLHNSVLSVLRGSHDHSQSPKHASPAVRGSKGRRVLLAEDNSVNAALALRLLEKQGLEVRHVTSGKDALAALAEEQFDLVLMDVQMPVMDGLEATAAIRAKERETGGHIPIVALTAHAMKGDRERCLAAGMDGYVTKPIRAHELREAVLTHLAAVSVSD